MWLFPFALVFLSGCTTVNLPPPSYFKAQGVKDRHIIDNVPVIAQQDHYCGPAALAMMLQHRGEDISQKEAAEFVYTPGRKGTFQHDMVSAMQRHGYLTIPVDSIEEALREISADNPVVIFQNLALPWYPAWHYSVLTGYDLNDGKFLVHGGTEEAKWKPFRAIAATWQRAGSWGHVAVKGGGQSPTATQDEILQASAGIEAAGFKDEAKKTYKAVATDDDKSAKAYFGLGNVAMEEEKYAAAEKYYRKAIKIAPDHYYSFNNLAYSVMKQGRNNEACQIIYNAIKNDKLSGGKSVLLDSQKEICP